MNFEGVTTSQPFLNMNTDRYTYSHYQMSRTKHTKSKENVVIFKIDLFWQNKNKSYNWPIEIWLHTYI